MTSSYPSLLTFSFDYNPIIRALFAGAAVLTLAGVICEILLANGYKHGLMTRFALDQEANVPTWFASILFVLVALALLLMGVVERRQAPRNMASYWYAMALVFFALSMDETASFHEPMGLFIGRIVPSLGPALAWAWVSAGVIAVVLFPIAFQRLLRSIPAMTRRRFFIAGAVFCLGALGLEVLEGWRFLTYGRDLAYGMITVTQESLEMVGLILFLRAILLHLSELSSTVAIEIVAMKNAS